MVLIHAQKDNAIILLSRVCIIHEGYWKSVSLTASFKIVMPN